MRAVIVLAIVGGGLGALVVSPYLGLLLYVWFAVFRPQEWSWGALQALRLSLLVGGTFVVRCLVAGVLPDVRHRLSIVMLLFLAMALVSQVGAVDPAAGWEGLDMLARMMVVALFAIALVNTPERFFGLMLVFAGSLAFHASKFGVGYLIRGGARFDAGVGGMFSDNNDFGLAIVRVVFIVLAVMQMARSRVVKSVSAVSLPLCVLATVATFSRGAALAMAAGAFTYLLLLRRKAVALLVAAAAAGTALLIVPIPSEYFGRLETLRTYEENQENSSLGRLHFWRTAVDMADDRPLGVGLRSYPAAYDRYDTTNGAFGTKRAVHSSHFQVLAEMGYPGLACWLLMHGLALWVGLSIRRRSKQLAGAAEHGWVLVSANALIASEVSFLVGGSFLAQALNDMNWLTFALIAALDRVSASLVWTEQAKGRVAVTGAQRLPDAMIPSRVGGEPISLSEMGDVLA